MLRYATLPYGWAFFTKHIDRNLALACEIPSRIMDYLSYVISFPPTFGLLPVLGILLSIRMHITGRCLSGQKLPDRIVTVKLIITAINRTVQPL